MTGTSAILFFHIDEEESANDAKSRLFKLIDLIPKVPGVALMILTTSNDFVLEEALEGVYSYDIVQVSHWSLGAFTIHVYNARLMGGQKSGKFVNVYSIEIVNEGGWVVKNL